MKIARGIYQLKIPIPNSPLGYLNCYLIEGKDGWFMIDTGWDTKKAFNTLQTGLKEISLKLTDISTILVTHAHPDHFGLVDKIKQMSPKTQLLTHRWESDLIESRYTKFSEFKNQMAALLSRHGVPQSEQSSIISTYMPAHTYLNVISPDRVLYGGEIISTGYYDLEIFWTPGHTPGHICVYESRNQLLFSGDHILPRITPNIAYHVQSSDNPFGDYLHALKKLQHLPVAKILPAHEDVFYDLPTRIEQIVAHHEERENEIYEIVAGECQNAWQISSFIKWDTPILWEQLPPLQKRFALMEVVAHLENMRLAGKIQRIFENNSLLYSTQ